MAKSSQPVDYGDDPYEEDYEYYEKKRKKRGSARRWGSVVSTLVILAVIFILILLVTDGGFRKAVEDMVSPGPKYFREYPEWADYTVERRITLSPTATPMSYTVDIPTPRDIPNASDPWLQDVKSIVSTPDRNEVKYPDYDWMVWETASATTTEIITIQYSIRTESAVWTIDPSESGTVDDIPQWLKDKYGNKTRQEWKIIPTHPDVVSISNQLVANKVTTFDKHQAIFNYMNENYEYETLRSGSPKYCNETLAEGRGDCDDQSVLYCAIARAAGLPAWLEFGALYNQQDNSWGGHAWIRVYIPYYYGGGHVFNIDIVNDHFLFRDAFRFTEWEADGNGEHLEDYYHSYGTNFAYAESYNTLSMRKSSETVKIGEDGRPMDEVVPGFEAAAAVPAMMLSLLILGRKRKRVK